LTQRKGRAGDGRVEDGVAVLAGGAGQTPDRTKPIAAVVNSGGRERREPGDKTQTPNHDSDPTRIAQISPFYGSLAWNQGGWYLTQNYY